MTQILVFEGDSITDAQRKREQPEHLGYGYVSIIAGTLRTRTPQPDLQILNRGFSGHRTCDLVLDWQARCIDLQPDIFSLYIGVNNTWRRYDQNDSTSAEVFEQELRQLLDRTFAETPATGAKSILIEPFVLDAPEGSKTHWRAEDLDAKAAAVKACAADYGTRFLPLQSLFDQACERAPAAFWAEDGVHPTPAGHSLIARKWLETMAPLFTS